MNKIQQAYNNGTNACMERSEKRMFIAKLMTISDSLALWAQDKLLRDNWSINDVKLHIKNAAMVCDRD